MIGIYKITNQINGKVYIGQAQDVMKRWEEHKKMSKYNNSKILYKAFKKYGIENFSFEVLEECEFDKLSELETKYIEMYDCYGSKGYNMTMGGEGSRGRYMSQEQKKNLSDMVKARNWVGENNPNYGNHALAGENHFNYGKHHSTETKEKIGRTRLERGIGKGANNPSARKVICDNMIFGCIKECANYYNTNYSTFKCYINGSRPMPKKFKDLGLMYYDEYLQLDKPSTTIESTVDKTGSE